MRPTRSTRTDTLSRNAALPIEPTIAMVNGWCFGGGFSPLVACDLAICADEATFGLSEINWGIPPGNLVSKAMADTVGHRQSLYYRSEEQTSELQSLMRISYDGLLVKKQKIQILISCYNE